MTLPPFHWWRTVFFLIPVIAVYTIVLGTASLVAGLVDRRGDLAHRVARAWGWLILHTTGVRLAIGGAALPPPGTSCLFVANHGSFFDVPVLFVAVPRQLRMVAKATLGRVPFIGWHLRRTGHVLVDRRRSGATSFRRMQRLVRAGSSLVVFPEAGRTNDGRLLPFKAGVFLLAIESGLPVVPISLDGMRDVMPKGRLMARPATVRVTIHDPIDTAGLGREDARALAGRVRDLIAAAVPGAR